MYPNALHGTFTQTVNSSQVFEIWIFRKQPKSFNKITKSGDQNAIENLQQVCLKQAHVFFTVVIKLIFT